MKLSKTEIKRKVKSWAIDNLFTYSGGDYQRERFSKEKFSLISNNMKLSEIGSVLDVGCNEGVISSAFAKAGKFCVGIDHGPCFLNHYLHTIDSTFGKQSAIFGTFPVSDENVENIPKFDVVLLLSVHHQLIKLHGIEYAERVVSSLIEKANRYFVIEFSGVTEKYGFESSEFKDNDEESVVTYAKTWLEGLEATKGMKIKYIGKNKEHREQESHEPYRFLFLLERVGLGVASRMI